MQADYLLGYRTRPADALRAAATYDSRNVERHGLRSVLTAWIPISRSNSFASSSRRPSPARTRWARATATSSDQVAVEAMREVMDTVPIDGTIVIGEGERDEAPMLYIGEKVGLGSARLDEPPAVQFARSTSPSIRWKARTSARPARRTRSPCSRRPRRAACCTRRTSTWKSWSSARARRTWSSLDAPVRDNLKAIAKCLARDVEDLVVIVLDRRAPRKTDRRHSRDRRPHPADRRRRSLGRHRRRGGRLRRARGHGHRRRAGRRADGGGHALSERRNLRAPGRQQARARGALPRDGDHRLQARSTRRRTSRPARTSSSRRPA